MHLLQERVHTDTIITVEGMPPKKTPERTMLACSRYYGTALAMNRPRYAATLKRIVIFVSMSYASLTRTKILRLICSNLLGVAMHLNNITVLLW